MNFKHPYSLPKLWVNILLEVVANLQSCSFCLTVGGAGLGGGLEAAGAAPVDNHTVILIV